MECTAETYFGPVERAMDWMLESERNAERVLGRQYCNAQTIYELKAADPAVTQPVVGDIVGASWIMKPKKTVHPPVYQAAEHRAKLEKLMTACASWPEGYPTYGIDVIQNTVRRVIFELMGLDNDDDDRKQLALNDFSRGNARWIAELISVALENQRQVTGKPIYFTENGSPWLDVDEDTQLMPIPMVMEDPALDEAPEPDDQVDIFNW